MEDGTTHCPVKDKSIGDFQSFMPDMVEGIENHEKDRDGFQGAKDSAPLEPVSRCSNPVIVVAGSNDPGDEDQSHLNIKPFLNYGAIHTRDLQ